jgi:hypothetical protein
MWAIRSPSVSNEDQLSHSAMMAIESVSAPPNATPARWMQCGVEAPPQRAIKPAATATWSEAKVNTVILSWVNCVSALGSRTRAR